MLRAAGDDVLDDPRIDVRVGDVLRDHVALHTEGPFDAIWLVVPAPTRLSDDRLLTAATFRALADLLAKSGAIVVPVRSARSSGQRPSGTA